jgi:hypothetical protein
MHVHTLFLAGLSALLLALPVAAQVAAPTARPAAAAEAPNRPFERAEAAKIVAELATQLEENFVFPEVGKAYSARLRAQLAAGAYDDFPDGRAFAKAVTDDLQAVHKDKHLKLHVVPQGETQGAGQDSRRLAPPTNAISRSGWLAPKVAYVRFDGFPGSDETLAALGQFLAVHKGATTLIIDARSHPGGGLAEMDLMFPQMFAKPTTLVTMDTRVAVDERGGSPLQEDASLRKISGPDGVVRREHFVVPAAGGAFSKAKVYLLTSGRTASAGEHLALSLKRTGRATLVGETTRGAGHYGGMVPVGDGYAAFIPVGRTFDPDTGLGWEGTGVAPHVAVPADKALDEALRLARVAVGGEAALAALK